VNSREHKDGWQCLRTKTIALRQEVGRAGYMLYRRMRESMSELAEKQANEGVTADVKVGGLVNEV